MISVATMPPLGTGLVYAITNSETGRRYIGSTCGTSARDRYWTHASALRHQRHSNVDLQADWNSFGEASFSLNILESGIGDRVLSKAEHQWIAHFRGQRAGVYNRYRRLAERAGVTAATIIRAEKGLPMRYLTTRRLAKALGVEPSALVGDEE